jgi:hypothetical protein
MLAPPPNKAANSLQELGRLVANPNRIMPNAHDQV